MKSKFLYSFIVVIILTLGFACVIPYPSFNNSIYSKNEQQIINDYNESELATTNTSPQVEVINLDWFSYMDNIFTKYKTTKVIDVWSGKEYYVKRMGGYNHADVQVIDVNNLNIFKDVYGGTWSWNRRPVWVVIDGNYYAGSSNGMPHGFDIIECGENGHTCIHFKNSKTHGTKRIDKAHQDCVEEAYNSTDKLIKHLQKNGLK